MARAYAAVSVSSVNPGSTPAVAGRASLATNTPATRDRYVDLLRAFSTTTVVVGHWLIALIWWQNEKIGVHSYGELMKRRAERLPACAFPGVVRVLVMLFGRFEGPVPVAPGRMG